MEYGSFFWCSVAFLVLLAVGIRRFSRRPAGGWRSRLVNAELVLAAALVPLVVAEGWFLFGIDTTDGAASTLTTRRWKARHLDPAAAYRGRRYRSPESMGSAGLSVDVIGDSITFGQGIPRVEDLYPSILERELRQRGVAADVINISHPGWNLPEETEALRKQYESGLVFDVVVLGFCLNDQGAYIQTPPEYRAAIARLDKPPALLAPLVERSFVFSYLWVQYILHAPPVKTTWDEIAMAFRSPEAYGWLLLQLEAFRSMVESHGGRLIVLTFPDTSAPWEHYRYREFHKKIGEYWSSAGVTHVDLLPVFERHPVESLRVGFMDTHPNELAHRLTAAELVGVLTLGSGFPGRAAAAAAEKQPR